MKPADDRRGSRRWRRTVAMPGSREICAWQYGQNDFVAIARQLVGAGAVKIDHHVGQGWIRRIQAKTHSSDAIAINGKPFLPRVGRCVG